MASTINAKNTSTGVVITPDASGQLELQTADTTRMTITSGGNVGIGTTSIGYKLDVATSSSTQVALQYTGVGRYLLGCDSGFNLIFSKEGTGERMRITSAGDLLLNQTANNNSGSIAVTFDTATKNAIVLQDTSTAYSTTRYYQWFLNSTGGTAGSIAHTAATTVAFQTTSDRRLKENIVNAPYVLDKVTNIKVRSFDWKQDGSHVDYGFIAQELYDIAPEVVGKGDDTDVINDQKGLWQVDYGRLTPILTKAIQELKAELDTVKAELATLKGTA